MSGISSVVTRGIRRISMDLVISGHGNTDKAALWALLTWKFQGTMLSYQPRS